MSIYRRGVGCAHIFKGVITQAHRVFLTDGLELYKLTNNKLSNTFCVISSRA
ncbi:hypothetical protein ACVWYG_000141 [Pedobacter sp. UYEF25]